MTKTEEYDLKNGYKTIKATRKCECCDVVFNIYKNHDLKHKKYCSRKCQYERKNKPKPKKFCRHCNLEFIPCKSKGKKQQFCSVKCRAQVIKPKERAKLKMIKNCEYCQKEIKIFHTQQIIRKKYCSRYCMGKHRWETGVTTQPPKLNEDQQRASKEKMRKTWQNKDIKRTTPLRRLIQANINQDNWTREVYKRDNYTCRCCNNTGGRLNAHHVKHFAVLFKEFLKLNSNLNPEDDKNELLRLALVYEPFWDINNGITLCEECHQKEHPKLNIIKKKN